MIAIDVKVMCFQCLKESYLKATGVGLHNRLSSIDFKISSPLSTQKMISDSVLSLPNEDGHKWKFDEIMLDNSHCAVVCYEEVHSVT